jgi:hypothetical protein
VVMVAFASIIRSFETKRFLGGSPLRINTAGLARWSAVGQFTQPCARLRTKPRCSPTTTKTLRG